LKTWKICPPKKAAVLLPGLSNLSLPNLSTYPFQINKQTNKGKTLGKGTSEEKRKNRSPNKRPHLKVQNPQ
jgi:hypothetical protein